MEKELKKSLYIGLGRAGIETIIKIKELFCEDYGEIPPMISFLGIDTCEDSFINTSITEDEKLILRLDDLETFYSKNKEHLYWIANDNISLIKADNKEVSTRSIARLSFFINKGILESRIQQAINKISNIGITNDSRYEQTGREIDFHIITSLCDITGSGIFIDLAILIKNIWPNHDTIGYGILPHIFENNITQSEKIVQMERNAYATIQELDWFMHLNTENSYEIKYINSSSKIEGRPFELFFLFDDKTLHGDIYSQPQQIFDLIADLSYAFHLSFSLMSTFDNIRHLIGNNQILGKKDWVFGFGECKIVLDSQKIRDIYIFKASKILINKMLNGSIPKDTAYTIANKWIDKPEVNIRENKENVMNFIPNQNESDNDTIVSNRITQVKHELIKLIKHLINDEGGIPNAIHVLQAIDFLINNFSNNMETELHEAEEGNPNRLKSQVTFMEEDLEKYQRKFFKSSSKIKEIENRIMNLSENANKLENRIYKIHKACNFFAIIKTTITEEISRIEQIKSKLESIKQEFNSLTIELDNSKNISQNVFNLQNLLTDKMDISDQEISYTDFVASTSDENTIYNWGEDSNENIKKSLSEYLDKYYFKKYGKLDISMAFKTFDESTITEIFERALRIASVPIDYDNLGYYSVIENIIHFLIPRNMDFDLNKIDIKSEPKSPTEILETDDLNRIVIQKNIEILHPFMITSIQNMEIKYGYTSSNKAYFSNAEIATRMENEGYSISPKGKK